MGKHPHHPMAVSIVGRELRQSLIAILTSKIKNEGIITFDLRMFILIMIMLLIMNEDQGIGKHAPFVVYLTIPFPSVGKRMEELMRHEKPSPLHEKKQVKNIWRKKSYCSHCNRNGHRRATCWNIHPEEHLRDKALRRKLSKAVVRQAKPPQGVDPFTKISEKWFVNMLSFHGHSFVNHLLHFKM